MTQSHAPHWGVVGNIVKVEGRDWALYGERTSRDFDFQPLTMTTYGELIQVREDWIVVASQSFDDGEVRQSMVIPISDVVRVWVLSEGKEQE